VRRGTFLLLVGVGVPTALLAAGWWLSSTREVEGRRREALALLHRTAEVVRGVLDASFEEMRLREDARPFDAYNHVYNPPGVIALGDAVALSPLAGDPEDARVVGYFQVDAGGFVRTPYEKDPAARTRPRSRLVATRIESPAFSELRALSHGPPPAAGAARLAAVALPQASSENKETDKGAKKPEASAETGDKADLPQSIAAYNTLQNQVYEELQQQDIAPEKLAELALSKKIPVTTRQDVDWVVGTRGYDRKKSARQEAPLPDLAVAPTKARPSTPPPPPVPTLDGIPVGVDYTPFVFDAFGDELVLYRLVSSGGSRSVQGALLDRGQIFDRWLPQVIERHSVASTRPTVVAADAAASCSLRTAASDILEGLHLCFPPEAVASVQGVPAPEVGLLFALVIVVAAAILATDLAARRADELARQRGAFISAVSHELRTPLTTLRMHAELLRDGLVSEQRKQKFHDDMVQESVRLSHLVENVLEATRLEEGRRLLRAQPGPLGSAVKGICAAQAPFLQTKGFTVEVDAAEVTATFDRQAVEQIVVNLLDNAAKYSAEAAALVVRVEVREEGGAAVIRVLDRGPGIPADERDRVFHRFHRVDRPGQDHVVGTGLGLSLVRELAQAHGGDAQALPRDGGGCCIEVRLPKESPGEGASPRSVRDPSRVG
jgi:signal transduction histidine kinase